MEVRTITVSGSNRGETGGGKKVGCSGEDSTGGFGGRTISETVGAGGCQGGDAGGADRSGVDSGLDSLAGMGSEGGAGGANS